jgi:CRISPR-associated endonuclease Csn1
MIARIAKISANGQIFMAAHNEANVDARNRDKTDPFGYCLEDGRVFAKGNGTAR